MKFKAIGGFLSRNGKDILMKTALAVGVIAGMAFLTDTPEEIEETAVLDDEPVDEVIETTATDVTVTEEN